MYPAILATHSWIRWAVVLLGLFAVIRALAGWTGRKPWLRADDRVGLLFTLAMDIQALFGLALYFGLSPYTALAMDNFGDAMRNPELRFWGVEHVFGGIVALALVHVGRVKVRRATDGIRRHRLAAIFFGLALLVIFLMIPWPGTPNARPLIPR